MIDVQEKKNKIIEFLTTNGPSLPVQVAKAIQMDPVFASAILSELLGTKEIKTSYMKIGASPLYLLPGQEEKLEEKTEHLKSIEKETQEKLKTKKIIIDEDEEPATRVALRNIKDFATPFKFKDKITWKYAFIPQEEIDKILFPKKEELPENYFIYKFKGRDKKDVHKNIEELEAKYGKGFVYDRDLKEEGESREDIINKFREKIKEFSKTNPKMNFIVDYKCGLGRLMEMEMDEGKKYGFKIIELNKKESIKEEQEVPKAWEAKKVEIKEAKEKSKKIENIFTKEKEKDDNKQTKKQQTFLEEIEQHLKNHNTAITAIEEVDKKKVVATVKSEEKTSILFAFNKARVTESELIKCYKEANKKNLPYQIITKAEQTKKLLDTIRAYQKLLKISKLENTQP